MTKLNYHKYSFKKRYALPKGHNKGPQVIGSLSTKLKFGKYIGYTIERLMETDPSYLRWLMTKCNNAKFQEFLVKKIYKILKENNTKNEK